MFARVDLPHSQPKPGGQVGFGISPCQFGVERPNLVG